MSDSVALVRFADTEIRCAYYCTRLPLVVPILFPLNEAIELLEGGMEPLMKGIADLSGLDEPEDLESVQVWTAYDSPEWWSGVASRSRACLWDGSDPYGIAFTSGRNRHASPPREVHLGTPEWVPAEWRLPAIEG